MDLEADPAVVVLTLAAGHVVAGVVGAVVHVLMGHDSRSVWGSGYSMVGLGVGSGGRTGSRATVRSTGTGTSASTGNVSGNGRSNGTAVAVVGSGSG